MGLHCMYLHPNGVTAYVGHSNWLNTKHIGVKIRASERVDYTRFWSSDTHSRLHQALPSALQTCLQGTRYRRKTVRAEAGDGANHEETLKRADAELSKVLQQPARLTYEEKERRTRMEDELKDSRNFIDYLAPRPVRRLFFGAGAVNCIVAFVVAVSKVIANPSLELAEGGVANVGINAMGLIVFLVLYWWDGIQGEKGKVRRLEVREAQMKSGDRVTYTSASGDIISRLKPVDDDWIIRRLDRWGQQDLLPQVGPKKGAILQSLVRDSAPHLIVEVGAFTGYSAIRMAQAMPTSCSIISFEIDFKWLLVAKRFVWQAKMSDRIDVRWGDATTAIPKVQGKIDFLFLDGKPWEYLQYLQAAEPLLSPGAIIVADNAGIFEKALTPYLDYVRNSAAFESKYVESTLEYRDDVPDGMEVSTYLG